MGGEVGDSGGGKREVERGDAEGDHCRTGATGNTLERDLLERRNGSFCRNLFCCPCSAMAYRLEQASIWERHARTRKERVAPLIRKLTIRGFQKRYHNFKRQQVQVYKNLS